MMSISSIVRRYTILLALAIPACAQTTPIVQPHMVFSDITGLACSGCSLYSYAAGTTTPQATYTDSTGATQNTNPVILGQDGGPLTPGGSSGAIWMSNLSYKFVLVNASSQTVFTVDNVGGGGAFPCGPAYSIQAANSSVTGFTCDSTITINPTAHSINVGTLPTNHVTIGALGTPTAWTFDTTTPSTALTSLGAGTVNAGIINQIAVYPATGTALSGSNALPAGITAVTQSPSTNNTTVATTAYVAAPGAITPTSLKVGSGVAMTTNQGTGTSVQHSTGTATANDCVKFDANGNAVDSGGICPASVTVSQPGHTFGTVYQNTSGSPILVTISGSAGSGCTQTAYIGSTSAATPSSLSILYAQSSSFDAGTGSNSMTYVVPPSWYYGANGSCALVAWTEAVL